MKRFLLFSLMILSVIFVFVSCNNTPFKDEVNPASDFEYDLTEQGRLRITKYVGSDTGVVIPDTIDGQEVGVIGRLAFFETDIKSVVIPDTVIYIEENAFWQCSELTSVKFGANLVTIRAAAFADCLALTSIDLSSDSMKNICELAFAGCTDLEEVKFGDNIVLIDEEAFKNCTSLKEVILPKNLKEIGTYAFGDCTAIERVWVPKTLETWGWSPFIGNISVTEIEFEDGLKKIGGYGAFAGCQVETLTIPASVEYIADIAFTAFRELKEVYFIGDAPTVGGHVFATPEQGVKVYYDPSTAGWDTTPLRNENILVPIEK